MCISSKSRGWLAAGMARTASGQAMLEFVLVFPIVLVFVMGIIEMSMLAVAHQVVNYAAFCAARAAIVNGAYDRAAVLAAMTLSPANDLGGAAPPGDLLSKVQTLKLRYAAGRFKNSFWQTYVWIDCYNQGGSRIQRFTSHSSSSLPAALPASTDYVKAGVLYLYRLQFPVIATIVNLAGKYYSAAGSGGDVQDIFYVAPEPQVADMPYDQWSEASKVSQSSGMTYIPIVKWCLMGKN